MSRWLITSAVAALLANTTSTAIADDQQQQPTDIGKVTASGRATEPTVVKPSPAKDRAAAIAEKQQAPNILDAQPLSEIVKLPDITTAEALQRIPGISLETDSGEGRFIHIRGLDADLNGTTYGGVRLPASNAASPSGGNRAVAFDTFPTGIVGGIEVTKTLRPDMDAEGLGGTINLVPRTGAEHGGEPFLDANLEGGYAELRQTPVWHADTSMGRSFDGGDGIGGLFAGANAFSVVLSAVYHVDQRGIDDIEESYDDAQSSGVPDKVLSNLQFRRYLYHRQRYGAAANFDARASDSTQLYLRVLYSGYLEGAHKHYLVLTNLNSDDGCTPLPSCIQDPNNPNGFIASQAHLNQRTTDTLERIQNALAVVGGSSVFSAFKLDYHASYAIGSDRYSSSYGSEWTDAPGVIGTPLPDGTQIAPNPVPIAYDTTTDPRYPRFATLDGTDPANPANYVLQGIGLGPSLAQDREGAAAVDLTIPTGSGDHTAEWKLGLSVRERHKTFSASSPGFTPTDVISLQQYVGGAPQIFYGDRYNIGPAINFAALRALVAANPQAITGDAAADASATTDDRENVYAAYAQYSARFGNAGVLAGVRVESTHATYDGNLYNSDADTNTPASVKNSYTNYFPTVQGRYDFGDSLIGRLTYSTGIARPGFQQITPGESFSVSSGTVSVGNPTLKPALGQSIDGTLEYYPGDGQIAALGLFYKRFHDYILQSQQQVQFVFPVVPPVTQIAQITSWSNGPAHAEGIEAQYQQKLQFLPAPLDGLGYSANITLVDSRAQIHPDVSGLLPSTSKVTWNAQVFYERGPLELRVAADYVGKDLFAFGSVLGNTFDVYSRHRLSMDVGSSYAITDSVKFYLNVKNLLNTPLEFTEGPSDARPIQREFYDMTFFAGLRMSF
jgi:TonB-dependent receptor